MAKRAFIVHGWGGYPEKNWFPWLKDQLAKKGYTVSVPQMPDTDYPKMSAWLERLTAEIGSPDEETYLIGHSLGCITILRYMEGLKPDERIGGAVLVAAFDDDLDIKELKDSDFFTKPIDWPGIKSHSNKFVAIFSDNDEYVSLDHVGVFRDELKARITIKHAMGHLNERASIP